MKKMFLCLAVAMMTTFTYAQTAVELAKQQRELNEINMKMLKSKPTKDVKKQAKELKKEGWVVPAGDPTIEQQLMQSQLLGMELMADENGAPAKRYLQHTAMQTSGSYNAGYAAARAAAMTEVASMMETQLVAAWQQALDNAQNGVISSTANDKFNQRAKAIVDQSISNAIPVMSIYRTLKNNSYQVQVRVAFDKKELAARLKRNMQKELEAEGDELKGVVDDLIKNRL